MKNPSLLEQRKAIPTIDRGGKDLKFSIIDIDKVAKQIVEERRLRGSSMLITLNPISESKYFEPHFHASVYRDDITGVYYGMYIGLHIDGNPKFRRIIIEEKMTLNLELDQDAKTWAIMRWHPQVEGTPWQVDDPKFRVYDQETEVVQITNLAKELSTAIKTVNFVPAEKLSWILRSLGIDFAGSTNPEILRGLLMKFAMDNPTEAKNFLRSKALDLVIIIRAAIDLGVINKTQDGDLTFDGVQIGVSEEDSMMYLAANTTILKRVTGALEKHDDVYQKIIASKENNKGKATNDNGDDPDKENHIKAETVSIDDKF